MKTIEGKILEGEQMLVVFKKHTNPKVRCSDTISVHARQFSVLRVETNYGVIAAEVAEIGGKKLDYSFCPGRNGDRYYLHADSVDL